MSSLPVSRRSLLLGAGVVAGAVIAGADATYRPSLASALSGWGGYRNGEIPLSVLSPVAGHSFRPDAATSLIAMRSAYQAALGRTLQVNDGYRDLAGQQRAWDDYKYHNGNYAAKPGTSNHGWALAADFGGEVYSSSTSAGHRWLQSNAERFDWWWAGRNFSQIENWHWEFGGRYTPSTPTDTNPEDVIMRGIYNTENTNDDTRRALVGEFSFQVISGWYSTSQWHLFGVENVTQADWDATKALVNARRTAAGMTTL